MPETLGPEQGVTSGQGVPGAEGDGGGVDVVGEGDGQSGVLGGKLLEFDFSLQGRFGGSGK